MDWQTLSMDNEPPLRRQFRGLRSPWILDSDGEGRSNSHAVHHGRTSPRIITATASPHTNNIRNGPVTPGKVRGLDDNREAASLLVRPSPRLLRRGEL